jgi:ribA/ribD-fused uncharacterized protein
MKMFDGDLAFLSNFYPSTVHYDGVDYPTVEHAYQAAKTLDKELRKKIKACKTPAMAKALGKKLPLRPKAVEMRIPIMRHLLKQKFSTEPLREMNIRNYLRD